MRTAMSFPRCATVTAAALCVATLPASIASAVMVVNNDTLAAPDNSYIGRWNGSSAVAIGPNWVISAKHVGGVVGGYFTMHGESYRAVEIREHATQDLILIRVAETLPGYHRIAANPDIGTLALLGGWGVTDGNPITNGYDWNGVWQETWGANTIENAGTLIVIRFDSPSSQAAVPHEAIFTVNDSGGGLFVYGDDGSLELAGIAVSVTGFGSSVYGNYAFCLNCDTLRSWISPIVDPGAPINSSIEAPRAGLLTGLDLGAIGAGFVGFALAWRRRRTS